MAADNDVAFERLALLGKLADKEVEMRSKQIAVGIVQQTVLEIPLDRQVTALREYIKWMERTISELSVHNFHAAEKEKNAASCNVAGSCAAVAAPPATPPS